jgi:hypothetical protein
VIQSPLWLRKVILALFSLPGVLITSRAKQPVVDILMLGKVVLTPELSRTRQGILNPFRVRQVDSYPFEKGNTMPYRSKEGVSIHFIARSGVPMYPFRAIGKQA